MSPGKRCETSREIHTTPAAAVLVQTQRRAANGAGLTFANLLLYLQPKQLAKLQQSEHAALAAQHAQLAPFAARQGRSNAVAMVAYQINFTVSGHDSEVPNVQRKLRTTQPNFESSYDRKHLQGTLCLEIHGHGR